MGTLSSKFASLALAASVLLPSVAMANPHDIQSKMDFIEKRYSNLNRDYSKGCFPSAARGHGGALVFDFGDHTSLAIKGKRVFLQWSMRTKRDSFRTCSGGSRVHGGLVEGLGKLRARM